MQEFCLWKRGLRNPIEITSDRKLQGWWLRFSPALLWMTENCLWVPVIHSPVTQKFLLWHYQWAAPILWFQTMAFLLCFLCCFPGHWVVFVFRFFHFSTGSVPIPLAHFLSWSLSACFHKPSVPSAVVPVNLGSHPQRFSCSLTHAPALRDWICVWVKEGHAFVGIWIELVLVHVEVGVCLILDSVRQK